MALLTILGRTNWEGGFYLKFKAEENSLLILKKIAEELGSEYFVDDQLLPKTFKYIEWKDKWIPISGKGFSIDIICGDKIIHLLVSSKNKLNFLTEILNKYSKWSAVKYKKGFGPEAKLRVKN